VGTSISEEELYRHNPIDFGLYIGNEVTISQTFCIGIDVFYQNTQTVISRIEVDDTRFEFHQNIGIRIKPAFRFKNNTIGLVTGVSGIYVFDKKELTGNQIDRYDEAYFYGLEYNRTIHHKWSMNLGWKTAKFHSFSHYTNAEMTSYTTFTLGLQYNIFGENE
jgi:hypothetical protein